MKCEKRDYVRLINKVGERGWVCKYEQRNEMAQQSPQFKKKADASSATNRDMLERASPDAALLAALILLSELLESESELELSPDAAPEAAAESPVVVACARKT